MSCDLFFDRAYKRETWYKFDESYIIYLVYEYFNFHDSISIQQFIDLLKKEYGDDSIKITKADKWLCKHLNSLGHDSYILKDNAEEIFNCLDDFKEKYYKNVDYSIVISHASDKLAKYFTNVFYDLKEALVEYLLLHVTKEYPVEYYCSKLLDLLLNLDSYLLITDQAVTNIDNSFYGLPIDSFVKDEITRNALMISKIYKIGDFVHLRPESQLLAFSLDIESISRLDVFSGNFEIGGLDVIRNCYSCLKDKEVEVISRRFSLYKENELTLEDVGSKLNLTRERIRQIEAKAYKRLAKYAMENRYVLYNAFVKADSEQQYYFSIEDGIELFKDEEILEKYALLCVADTGELIYDQEYKLFYNSKYISLNLIISEIEEDLGDVITVDEYRRKNSVTQAVINKKYTLKKGKLYVNKKLNYSDFILKLIDDNFPEGYKIGSGEKQDYDELRKLFIDTYGDEIKFPAERAVSAMVMRKDTGYCLVGRGLYKRRIYCVQLPDYLKEKVIDFILESDDPVIYYVSIYEHLKKEFNDLGVNNYYYMKGLIDPYLEEDFTTKRDYVLASHDKVTAKDTVKNYMRSIKGIFTMQDLRKRFIGVKDYVFIFIFTEEEENGLIALHNGRFAYAKNVEITPETIENYRRFIENLFALTGQDVLSSRKIYGRLALTNRELLKDLSFFAEDQFGLFSLTKYLFKDVYNFRRPYVFKADIETMTKKQMILNYAEKLEVITPRIIQDFSEKMNISGLYSYLNFIDEMSETHVQTGSGTLISKTKLNLSDEFLNSFGEMLQLVFKNTEELKTDQFSGYVLFPKCEYTWNQYLLAGIVRSYFDDTYEIKNTDGSYNETNFVIRRIS